MSIAGSVIERNSSRAIPGGLIFSAGILHEATPVTVGGRYVLLTFFHSDAAEVRRLRGHA
jgi:hypothetical protein